MVSPTLTVAGRHPSPAILGGSTSAGFTETTVDDDAQGDAPTHALRVICFRPGI